MTRTIEAVYENGLFRPLVSVDLPEKSVIEIDLHLPEDKEDHLLTDAERLQRNPEEWIKRFREWANQPRDVPDLPDEALRRENIYEDRV
jgi:predicted DNA-binding antitoxin AbrB/MazE fold protein